MVTSLVLLSCKDNKEEKKVETASTSKQSADTVFFTNDQFRLSGIEIGLIEKRTMNGLIKVNGQLDVEPHNLVTISAPLGGYIKTAGLLPGQRIQKGQLIASLENPEFITLQQDYLETKSKLEYLEQEYKRQQELRKEEVNSAKTFQQVTADYHSMQARISALDQKLHMAGINMNQLESGQISRSGNLYAPISGYVKTSNVNMGKYVNPTDVLFELTNTNDIHLALNVFEKDVAQLQVGQIVKFSLANETGFNRTATVFLIGKATGEDRTVPVHCHLSNGKDSKLLPGMYVKAFIETNPQQVPVLPVDAVVQSEGKDYILIKVSKNDKGFKFRLEPVKKGMEKEGYTEITLPAGIDATTIQVVFKGAYTLLSALKNTGEE
ncbi:efflux RND transporter periplasmic adaptor subunit [Flavitalea flava]